MFSQIQKALSRRRQLIQTVGSKIKTRPSLGDHTGDAKSWRLQTINLMMLKLAICVVMLGSLPGATASGKIQPQTGPQNKVVIKDYNAKTNTYSTFALAEVCSIDKNTLVLCVDQGPPANQGYRKIQLIDTPDQDFWDFKVTAGVLKGTRGQLFCLQECPGCSKTGYPRCDKWRKVSRGTVFTWYCTDDGCTGYDDAMNVKRSVKDAIVKRSMTTLKDCIGKKVKVCEKFRTLAGTFLKKGTMVTLEKIEQERSGKAHTVFDIATVKDKNRKTHRMRLRFLTPSRRRLQSRLNHRLLRSSSGNRRRLLSLTGHRRRQF